MALVTTAGSALANSYCTAAFITAYSVGTAWASSWEAAEERHEELTLRACRAIEVLPFPGYPSSDDQALQFPRTDVPNVRGGYLATDVIPEAIKRAQAHVACWLSSLEEGADPFSLDDTGKLSSLKVGPIALEFRGTVGADGGSFLATVIVPLLRPWGLLGAAGSVRLVRG